MCQPCTSAYCERWQVERLRSKQNGTGRKRILALEPCLCGRSHLHDHRYRRDLAILENVSMNTNKWLSYFTAAPAGLVWQSGLATATALLWLVAVPPFGIGWLAWLAFAPLLYVLCDGVSWTRALWLGWLTGLLFTFFAANWIAYPMITYGGMPAVAAYAVAFLFAALLACFPALLVKGGNTTFVRLLLRVKLIEEFITRARLVGFGTRLHVNNHALSVSASGKRVFAILHALRQFL